MQTAFLKLIDTRLGSLLCSLFTSPQLGPSGEVKSILIIRPGGIGDAVLLSSAISCLKKTIPHIRITILAERRNAAVFPLIPGVDRVLCYDRPGDLIHALRSRFDTVIDTEQWHRLSAVVARLVRSPMKIGFDTNERRRMFTHCIPYNKEAYEAENFLALLKPLGVDCRRDDEMVALSLPPQSVSRAEQLLQPLGPVLWVALFPGASIPEKRWGSDRFRQLAELLSVFGIAIVVVGGKEDHQSGEIIAGGGLGLNLAGLTSLPETAAVIRSSSLLVSGDSGVLHIAAALGVPTVSLFGPGKARKWAPQGDFHTAISKGLSCSPCTLFGTIPPCPIDAQCMKDITVDKVLNCVTMLLTDFKK